MNTGMNITKKAEIFASHLVEVAPHIGRIKPSLLLPKEILEKRRLGRKKGISDTEKEFVAQNISASKLMLMPDEETELLKIEYKARHICKRALLVQDYMLYDNYRSVCEDFDACKAEYFAMRDQIDARWDELLHRFSEGLKEYINSCGIPKKKAFEIHRSMMNQMPTHKVWYNSFQFWLEVREYPVQPGSLPGMDEKWMERTENLVKSLISEQVSDLFDRSAAILQNLSIGKSITKKAAGLINAAGQILNHAVVQEPDMLETARKITQLSSYVQDEEAFAENLELYTGDLMRLADSYGIYLDLSSLPVSVDYLMSLGENTNQTALTLA